MGWFTKMCRNMGLAVHNMRHPEGKKKTQVVNKTVEEKQINRTTTLRRTTIDEVEVKEGGDEAEGDRHEGT